MILFCPPWVNDRVDTHHVIHPVMHDSVSNGLVPPRSAYLQTQADNDQVCCRRYRGSILYHVGFRELFCVRIAHRSQINYLKTIDFIPKFLELQPWSVPASHCSTFSRAQIGDKGAPQYGSRDAACDRGKREGRNWGTGVRHAGLGGGHEMRVGDRNGGGSGHRTCNGAGKSPAGY